MEQKEFDEDEKKFRMGNPVSSEKLDDVNLWDVPRMTENEALIFKNAFNHTFEITEAEEVTESAPPTLEEIEAIRKEAYREGYNEGRHLGHQEGHEEGKATGLEEGKAEGLSLGQEQGLSQGLAQATSHIEQFAHLLQQLNEPLNNINEDTEQQLLQLISLLAKRVIMHELKTHPEHIVSAIKLGIDALPAKRQKITLRLHPEDVKLVEQLIDPLKRKEMRCVLEVDKLLNRGELKIDTDYSHIDLTLEKRMQKVFEELDAMKGEDALSRGDALSEEAPVADVVEQDLQAAESDGSQESVHVPPSNEALTEDDAHSESTSEPTS